MRDKPAPKKSAAATTTTKTAAVPLQMIRLLGTLLFDISHTRHFEGLSDGDREGESGGSPRRRDQASKDGAVRAVAEGNLCRPEIWR